MERERNVLHEIYLVPTGFLAPMAAAKIEPQGEGWKAGGWKEYNFTSTWRDISRQICEGR
jgi:hypothetical protein